ncbi:MAG TPA: hypothetical protein PK493_19930, partial [Pseudomonadota bacterium]|nr:hypothetical protein [Pseudomonadota bacterium]
CPQRRWPPIKTKRLQPIPRSANIFDYDGCGVATSRGESPMNMPLDVLVDAFLDSAHYRKAFQGQMANWEALVPNVLDQYCMKKGIELTAEEKNKVITMAGARRFDAIGPDSGTSEAVPAKRRLWSGV